MINFCDYIEFPASITCNRQPPEFLAEVLSTCVMEDNLDWCNDESCYLHKSELKVKRVEIVDFKYDKYVKIL
jgi:hypothetical protein